MLLGIEIGGTKLQLGVAPRGAKKLTALERYEVDSAAGAQGILEQIEVAGRLLQSAHAIEAIGVGFGGPVDSGTGRIVKSHQIEGWEGFNLAVWIGEMFGVPVAIANDCDAAGLAETHLGAGSGPQGPQSPVLFVTVGTGIGGGLIVDGEIYRGGGCAAAEIGHLRPGLQSDRPDETVESMASGWGIAAAARSRLDETVSHRLGPLLERAGSRDPEQLRQRLIEQEENEELDLADLLLRCGHEPENLSAQQIAAAAEEGNRVAGEILNRATQVLGWAIAQAVTLTAPQVVVVGGGVSLIGNRFLTQLRQHTDLYVFPPLSETFQIVPSKLGEEVVVHGALMLAARTGHP